MPSPPSNPAGALDPRTLKGLARSRILAALSEEGLARLIGRGVAFSLDQGAALFARGDAGDALFIVLEGEIEIAMLGAHGRQVRIASAGPGEAVGEMAVLDGGARSADALAARRCRLVKLGRDAVFEALMAEPRAMAALLVDLSTRLRAANANLEAAVLLDLKGKAARLLLEESADGEKLVQLTQTEMARRLSVSREKLNRRLHAWQEGGHLALTRQGVRVLHPEVLRAAMTQAAAD